MTKVNRASGGHRTLPQLWRVSVPCLFGGRNVPPRFLANRPHLSPMGGQALEIMRAACVAFMNTEAKRPKLKQQREKGQCQYFSLLFAAPSGTAHGPTS